MQLKHYLYLCIVIAFVIVGCKQDNSKQLSIYHPKVYEAVGTIVTKDSIQAAKVVPFDESKLQKISVPSSRLKSFKSITLPQSNTVSVPASKPHIVWIGKGNNPAPKQYNVVTNTVVAGTPKVVLAKDPYLKVVNPQNFNCYGQLEGLLSNSINQVIQTNDENIWVATNAGVTKFDGKFFTHYTEKEGLPQNIITSIIEDIEGNLWFGTVNAGISKFDGKNITNYGQKEGLVSCNIKCLLQDKKGNIWIGTDNGLVKFDTKTFTYFTNIEGLIGNNISSLLIDKKENLWIATETGIASYDGKCFKNYDHENGLEIKNITSLAQDKSGAIWIGSGTDGVAKLNRNIFLYFKDNSGLLSNKVSNIIIDKRGEAWFATDKGVSKLNDGFFTNYSENEGLKDSHISSICEDRSGNVWLATKGGLSKLDCKLLTSFSENDGLYSSSFSALYKSKNGTLWVGTKNGEVLNFNGKFFTYIIEQNQIANNLSVQSFYEDKFGNIWISTTKGALKFDGSSLTIFNKQTGLSSDSVSCVLVDKKGFTWFGTLGNGVTKLNGKIFKHYAKKQGIAGNYISSLYEDKNENIWIGTLDGGLTKFDGNIITKYTETNGICNNTITNIFSDNLNNIWIATNGGVTLYNTKTFINFTEKEGLSNNQVTSGFQDKKGNVWFSTLSGVSKISNITLSELKITSNLNKVFSNYSSEDGLLLMSKNINSVGEDKNGLIVFSSNEGIYSMRNEGDGDSIPPTVSLTNISLFNEKIDWANLFMFDNNNTLEGEEKDTAVILSNGIKIKNFHFDGISKWNLLPQNLELFYNNNYLTFNFIGVSQKYPKKVRYKYILEGFDEGWSATTRTTYATYANLPHGTYTFIVKATNSNDIWSNEYKYSFTVNPPWWKTYLAYAFYIILIVGSVWYYIKWRERQFKERQKELEKIVDERTIELVKEKKIVEEKNREIIDSIEYAKLIQSTILPSKKMVSKYLPESFILYLPKDIVAGDFYWMEVSDDGRYLFFAACDSTGHGVPGAMVSVVCHNALNKAIKEFKKITPADILNKVAEIVVADFNKNIEEGQDVKDGMDASLCTIDLKTGQILWAGAHNPLFIIRDKHPIFEIKGDNLPVGQSEVKHNFTNHELNLTKGDLIYLITDGYADQFGGPKNKKFQRTKLKELLFEISSKPMNMQLITMKETFDNWKGNNEQIDDVTIMGVKI